MCEFAAVGSVVSCRVGRYGVGGEKAAFVRPDRHRTAYLDPNFAVCHAIGFFAVVRRSLIAERNYVSKTL